MVTPFHQDVPNTLLPAPADPPPPARPPGLLEVVWRARAVVVVATLLAGLIGYGASLLQDTRYDAEARLLLSDPRQAGIWAEAGPAVARDPSRYVRNQAEFTNSAGVAARAADLLDDQTSIEDVVLRSEARPSSELDLITVRALGPSAEAAADLANAVADAYDQLSREDLAAQAERSSAELFALRAQVQQRVDQAEAGIAADPSNTALAAEREAAVVQLSAVQSRIDQINVEVALFGSAVQRIERAQPAGAPSEPRPARNAALAAAVGLLAAVLACWWRAEHRQLADSGDDAAPVLGAPLLGVVPEWTTAAAARQALGPSPAEAEAYQFIAGSLESAAARRGATSVLVTSARPAEGKTATTMHLALAAASDSRRLVLVDADERRQGLTKLTAVRPDPGLTDLADPRRSFDSCAVKLDTSGADLRFVPVGTRLDEPASFFRSKGFHRALSQITEHADLVLIDSPPALAVSDTSAIAGVVDGVIIVVRRGTPLRLLADLRRRLEFVGTPILGYVFNRAVNRTERYPYGYEYASTGA